MARASQFCSLVKAAPQIQPATPGILTTAMPRLARKSAPALHVVGDSTEVELAADTHKLADLRAIGSALEQEPTLSAAALRLSRSLAKLMRLDEAHCVWIDWPYRTTHTVGGPIEDPLEERVLTVAGRGRRYAVDDVLIEPIGRAPARAVLVLRKPRGTRFDEPELQMIGALAIGVAPRIDALIAQARVRGS